MKRNYILQSGFDGDIQFNTWSSACDEGSYRIVPLSRAFSKQYYRFYINTFPEIFFSRREVYKEKNGKTQYTFLTTCYVCGGNFAAF